MRITVQVDTDAIAQRLPWSTAGLHLDDTLACIRIKRRAELAGWDATILAQLKGARAGAGAAVWIGAD
ncbi:MAG: hypothetical protein C4346_12015 [Chloroflexota bacterium]